MTSFSWFLGARPRTGMSDCLENTQCEIPRSARNDSLGRVITQTAKGETAALAHCRLPTAYCPPPSAFCPDLL
jgi:hypothetical protein